MADQVLQYALTGDASGAKAAFADVGAAIATTAKQIEAASKSTASIASKLDKAAESALRQAATSSEAKVALQGMTKALQDFGIQIPGLGIAEKALNAMLDPMIGIPAALIAASAAMGKFALDNADLVEHLSNLEGTTGLTVDQLYTVREASLQAGLEFEATAKGVQKMETSLGQGNKELKAMGLTGGDVAEDLALVADAFNHATSQGEKNRIAMAAFGKGFADMLPLLQQGGDAIRALGTAHRPLDIQKYRDLDNVSDSIGQAFRDLKFTLGDIAAGPATDLLSVFNAMLGTTRDIAVGFDDMISRGGGANAGVAEAFLSKYTTKKSVNANDPRDPGRREIITSVSSDRLIPDFAALPVQERQRILDGIYNLDKSTASTTMRSLFDSRGQINGLSVIDLAKMTRETGAAAKATPTETPEEKDAREKAAQKELDFRRDLKLSMGIINADADDKEVLQIKAKYAKLRQEHKQFADSISVINDAELSEIIQYNTRQASALQDKANKAFLDATGIDWQTYALMNPGGNEPEQGSQSLTNGMRISRRSNLVDQIKSSGIGQISGNQWTYQVQKGDFSDYRQIDLASETTQYISDAYNEASDAQIKFIAQSRENAEAFQKQWQGVYDSISDTIATNLGPALIDLFSRPQDALEELGDVGKKILSDLATQLLEVGLKWAILSAFAGGAGGKSPGTFLSFLSKSFGGHADGTLSSPGGLKYLGEQGPELVTTPMGSRYMASYGLYHVPSGTRVEKATVAPVTFAPQVNVVGTSDPAQTAIMVDRRIRELYAEMQSDEYRGRIA